MRSIVQILSLVLVAVITVLSTSMALRRIPAEDLIVNRKIIDLGEMHQGESRVGDFLLTNDSSVSIRIDQVLPTCQCTVATLSTKYLKPHESLHCRATYDAGPNRGLSKKTIQIVYTLENGEKSRIIFLGITAHVNPDYAVEPLTLHFDGVAGEIQSLRFRPINIPSLKVLNAYSTDPDFRTKINPPVEKSDEWLVDVIYDPVRSQNASDRPTPSIIVSTTSEHEASYYAHIEFGK